MDKVAVVVFDSHLHEISVPGSHYTLVVPGASNEEVADILREHKVSVWNDHYITKAVRVLTEAGYPPVVLDGVVGISPHEGPEVYTVEEYYPHTESRGAMGKGIEVPEDEDDEDEDDE